MTVQPWVGRSNVSEIADPANDTSILQSSLIPTNVRAYFKTCFSGTSGKSSKIDFCHIWPLEASRGVQNAATGCGIILPARDRHSEKKKFELFLGRANSARKGEN